MTKTLQNKVMDIAEIARWLITGFLASTFIMWIINITGNKEINGMFGLIGLVAVVFNAIRPQIIGSSMILGGIFAFLNDQDKTQGVAKGVLWLYRLVMVVLYGFLLLATILTSWSFEENKFAFWGLFLVIIALVTWQQVYQSNSKWGRTLPYFYLVLCAIVLVWSTFGGSWRGEAFDPVTGDPLHMVDPVTGNVDSLKRSPAECKKKTCYSAETGQALRPMTYDEAIRRNPLTAVGAYASDAKAALPVAGASKKAPTTTSCGKDVTWEAPKKERSYPTVQLGCTQRFITSYRGQLHLHAMDRRLDGEPSKYYVIERPTWELIKITPKKSIPTGMDPVTITLVTTEESIAIKNKIVADDEALKKEAGL